MAWTHNVVFPLCSKSIGRSGQEKNKEKRSKLRNKNSRGNWISSVNQKTTTTKLISNEHSKTNKSPQYVVK